MKNKPPHGNDIFEHYKKKGQIFEHHFFVILRLIGTSQYDQACSRDAGGGIVIQGRPWAARQNSALGY